MAFGAEIDHETESPPCVSGFLRVHARVLVRVWGALGVAYATALTRLSVHIPLAKYVHCASDQSTIATPPQEKNSLFLMIDVPPPPATHRIIHTRHIFSCVCSDNYNGGVF